MPGVGHFALDARMRPVAAPYQPLRIGLHQRLVKRPRVGIVGRVLAETMRARQLGPAPAFADGAKQALEALGGGAGAGVGAAHMVDHHGQPQRFQHRNRLRQILDVDPQLQMPAEFRHDRCELFGFAQRHAAAIMQLAVAKEMIEAQAADANRVPRTQFVRRNIRVGYRDAAQAIWLTPQRVEHCRIVTAMRTALHQHAARKTDRIQHAEIFFQRRIGRRVAAIVRIRKAIRRTEHMRMRIAGARRQRHARTADFARRQTGGNHRRCHRVIPPSFRQP